MENICNFDLPITLMTLKINSFEHVFQYIFILFNISSNFIAIECHKNQLEQNS